MKKYFTLILILSCLLAVNAQQSRKCVSHEILQKHLKSNPELVNKRNGFEKNVKDFGKKYRMAKKGVGSITLPVVVHIIYRTDNQNISDAEVFSQIEVINKDFTRRNTDTSNTPEVFKSVAANIGIEFCLASSDPAGKKTIGITRTKTTKTNIGGTTNDYAFTSKGGADIWDPTRYINIWVCEIGDNTLGFASFPGDPMPQGLIIDPIAFGTINSKSPYNLGRTVTHELGHYFNLIHIWGDSTCGDDLVDDTPTQEKETSGCPTNSPKSCSSLDMIQNYMDYSYDVCMNLFTEGQKIRILATLNGSRANLKNSDGCDTVTEVSKTISLDEYVKVFPNPVSSILNIEYYKPSEYNSVIRLLDLTGLLVFEELNLNKGVTKTQINVTNYPSSIYLLQLIIDGKIATKKIVVE